MPDNTRATPPEGAGEAASYAEQVTPPLDAGSEVSEQAREEADAIEQLRPRRTARRAAPDGRTSKYQ